MIRSNSKFKEDDFEEPEEGGLIRTCHLCGKATCGQRRGRVRCAYCKRVFCLQQLYKKFKIKAVVNDPHFKCPRCLGICCCVTNCQKPPPHVHCKVYKVRQNKRRNRELVARENAAAFAQQQLQSAPLIPQIQLQPPPMQAIAPMPTLPTLHQIGPLPPPEAQIKIDPETAIQPRYFVNDTPQTIITTTLPDPYQISYSDTMSTNYFYNNEIPGIQHSDWLTQLNLKLLDGGEHDSMSTPSNAITNGLTILNKPRSFSLILSYLDEEGHQFVDKLRNFFTHRSEMNPDSLQTLQDELIHDADQLQLRAEKSDVVFRMVDTFNRNTVHATVTWHLMNNSLGKSSLSFLLLDQRPTSHAMPALFTIVHCCPTILFSLETNTSYGEKDTVSSVSITFFNTSAIKDIKSLCTCIALINGTFQHYRDIRNSESWTEDNITWKNQDNIDTKLLASMLAYGEQAKKILENSTTRQRVVISYSRSSDDNSFENLPILSLVLKRISSDYPSIIYALERMMCDEKRVVCVLVFSEEQNWVKIINSYESNLEVCSEDNNMMMNRVNSQPVLLDL